MHKYFPHTDEDIRLMLNKIGAKNIDELFKSIPKNLLISDYEIDSSLSDYEISKKMNELASLNKDLIIFRGAGAYDTYVPSPIKSLISRQEFLTSYTPYQPEVSQGTLQYIFEYQSMVCELTGMDVSNASMYDGSTATAEAMLMAEAITNKNKVLISNTVNPKIIEVVKTYARFRNIEVVLINSVDGITDINDVKNNINDACALIVSQPNYYGIIEDYSNFSDIVHENGGLFIMNYMALALPILKTPRSYGADISCGDFQPFGISLNFGGPYLGYLACISKYMRKMPGRICGLTNDLDGKRGFVLTLQAREQHIRRAKANSNICSNQSLMALSSTIYLSLLGKKGVVDVANLAIDGAHYLFFSLLNTNKFEKVYDKPFFNEFVLKAKFDAFKLEDYLLKKGILGPLHLGNNELLFSVTDKRSKKEIDDLVRLVGEFK